MILLNTPNCEKSKLFKSFYQIMKIQNLNHLNQLIKVKFNIFQKDIDNM